MENVLILIFNDEAPRNMGYVKGSSWTNQFFLLAQHAASFSPMGKALRKVFEEQPTRRFWPPHHLVDSAWSRRKETDGYSGKCDENG